MEENRLYWNLFAGSCLPSKKGKALLAYFGTPKEIVTAAPGELLEFFRLAACLQFTGEEKQRLLALGQKDPVAEYELLGKKGLSFVLREEAAYPERLRACEDAPYYLYYRGVLPGQEQLLLSLIGARRCTPYGEETARILAGSLCAEGVGIVSGLALGVDRAAHEGALAAGGTTIAVLGCGADRCYPQTNQGVYEKILEQGGAIISEYPPGTPPLPCFFPQRNRIIAGISAGVIVTEARKKSGTLITVSLGLDYGRNIYAVPGRVTDVLSEGCNYLIREGAKPVLSSRDILMDYPELKKKTEKRKRTPNSKKYKNIENGLASDEKIVYASLRLKLQHIEEIQKQTGLDATRLAIALASLMERGCMKRYGQAYYALSGEE